VDLRRVDAGLAALLDDAARPGHHASVGGKPDSAVVFLDLADGAALEPLPGVEVHGGRGPIHTATVALGSIDPLSEMEGVRRIVASRRLHPHMDVAAERAGVIAFRHRTGATGRRVVVGVVDTGVETDHPAFSGRILRLWDQTLPGPGVAEGSYGMELTGQAQQLSQDSVGHGTHVTGIAAGDDATYSGVAPGAALVIVKSDLIDAHVANGLRYIFRVAAELDRPAVAILTAGGADDPHDGTDAFSAIIDAESGPGRIICCSAGNDGDASVHAQLELQAGAHASIAFAVGVPATTEAATTARFTGWYSGADQMAVAVVSPTGVQTPFQPVDDSGPPTRLYQVPGGDVRIITPGPDAGNGDHAFLVEVTPSALVGPSAIPTGWAIRLRADHVAKGRVDVWSLDGEVAHLSGRHVRHSVKVGAPAAASRAVTVGAYTTKVEWSNVMGHGHQAGFTLDDICTFSSQGPCRNGAPKPDLVAPGAMVAASLSGQSPFHPPYLADDLNVLKAGSSASAALVGGVIALLLEQDSSLDPEGVKNRLRSHSRIPGHEPGQFDPAWGYGLIDAKGLCSDVVK
jgi:subtilisin family serine protease